MRTVASQVRLRVAATVAVVLLFTACENDIHRPLSGDYYFVSLGGASAAITRGQEAVVPCTVTDYDHNSDHIVALSEPKGDCSWDVESAPGYYVIDVATGGVRGPLTPATFRALRDSLDLPSDLFGVE